MCKQKEPEPCWYSKKMNPGFFLSGYSDVLSWVNHSAVKGMERLML